MELSFVPPVSLTGSQDVQRAWDTMFQRRPWGKYPPEEAIRFVMRRYGTLPLPDRACQPVLDLACGTGAVTWYLAREGFAAVGVDGSETALNTARERFAQERLAGQFFCAPLDALPFENNTFDAVLDVGGITSNPWPVAQQCAAEVARVLRPGGAYFGIYAGNETQLQGQRATDDPGFYETLNGGAFGDIPCVRLYTQQELRALWQPWTYTLEVDVCHRTLSNQRWQVHQWFVQGWAPPGA
jgi:SAM-dependent methyltransferase